MRPASIVLRGFMSHEKTVIELPATGVVLVTGPNGAGKSSLIEAVSFGGWGQSLRKKTPWSGQQGLLELRTHDGLVIERKKTKSKAALSFEDRGKSTDYENATKTQEALTRLIGEHEIWRRANILSSQDAHSFSTATDTERKRMIESVMCLTRFDAAHAAVVKERRLWDDKEREWERTLSVLEERVANKKAATEEPTLEEAKPKDSVKLEAASARLKEKITKHRARLTELNEERDGLKAQIARRDAEFEIARRKAEALKDDACDECGKPYTREERAAAAAKLRVAEKALAAARESTAAELDAVRDKINTAKSELDEFHVKDKELSEELWRSKSDDEYRAQRKARVKKAAEALEAAYDERDAAKAKHDAAKLERDVLRCVEEALGLKGVRAHILQRALVGIEEIANVWLSRVAALDGMELTLRLNPYSEKSGGGVKDSISLEIEGAGNGHGYQAASGGERRRIDCALTFALAEIAEASSGADPGTLFMDEILDSVDAEGIEAVADVVSEISKTRCVVVISHNPLVQQSLSASIVKHLTINKGTVTDEL